MISTCLLRRAIMQFMSRPFASSGWVTKATAQRMRPRMKWKTPATIACVSFLFQAGLFAGSHAWAQSIPIPKVLTTFEQQALLAFNPGAKTLASLTMTGNATWIAGSLQESGNVVLKASADGSTAETWTLPTQSHAHAATAWGAGRSCSSKDHKGVVSVSTDPNCMRSLPWFAPWLGFSFISQGVVLGSDITQAADKASGNEKLAFQTGFSNNGLPTDTSTAELAQLESRTAVTVTFDRQTALSSVLDFAQILDSDPAHTIQYRIVFSDFRAESGYMVPHHVQRYIQRTLQADITITTVNIE